MCMDDTIVLATSREMREGKLKQSNYLCYITQYPGLLVTEHQL